MNSKLINYQLHIPRIHAFEFEDQKWFPKIFRKLITDLLQYQLSKSQTYSPIIPILKRNLALLNCHDIIDLCSGSAGSLIQIQEKLRSEYNYPVRVTLTDFFPNLERYQYLHDLNPQCVYFINKQVDATKLDIDIKGFRTLFTSFHHFKPDQAKSILVDAYNKNEAIGIFEFTSRSVLNVLKVILFAPFTVLIQVPMIRPFNLSYFFWTYIVPISPFLYTWDAVISHLRSYSRNDLCRMIQDLNCESYSWEIGEVKQNWFGFKLTYLIGKPRNY